MKLSLHAVLLSAVFILSACNKEAVYQEEGFVFGTRVEISIVGVEEKLSRQGVASVMQEFQRLHNLLHAWKPSALSEINSAFAKQKSIAVTPEIEAMLRDATRLSEKSGGLFNPAIGGLVKLWGFQADEYKAVLPDEKQVAALVAAQPRMRDIAIASASDKKVAQFKTSSSNPSVQLDLGGYAKGYALDRAVTLLKQQGIHNALINIGGNVIAMGTHGDRPWRVGIQHPRKPGPIATLELHDGEAIGTSGDYQRYFELNGKRYCHVIDPRNGQPVQGVEAVTVLTQGNRAGVLSDATSKPLFIAGTANWLAAAKQMNIRDALLIDTAGVVHLTAAMKKRLEFTDKNTVTTVSQ